MNLGPVFSWIAFLASLTSTLAFLAATGGRKDAERPARLAFVAQWVGFLGATIVLWRNLFAHDFRYEYVATYSSRLQETHYVFAAFWGGQEGTFLLWALITASFGLVLMRLRQHPLTNPAMLFLNMPLVMLSLVTVMRGPFLMFPAGRIPLDGQGLNPLLQDPWMTIHPPVLFVGFSSLAVPFAIAMAALVRRDYDGWVRLVLPWVGLSTTVLATGFIMGGVWAYKVLGWGGYWGWDPVENGSFIPWLSNMALLHGLLVQRVTGSLRRTNFFLAVTSYVLVLYASFLTRSGVLADFSVHSFANLGLSGFLLSFLFLVMGAGYGMLLFRLRDIPGPKEPLGSFSRESMMWLGQLVFMLMAALIGVGMSAPLITRMFGPPSNVQTSFYNLVNAPLAIAMCLLLGVAPLMRWRKHEHQLQSKRGAIAAIAAAVVTGLLVVLGVRELVPLLATFVVTLAYAAMVLAMPVTMPSVAFAAVVGTVAVVLGVREAMPAALVFSAAFAVASNIGVTLRGMRAGWKHGVAYLAHTGVSIMLIGIVSSSGYGRQVQVQLPRGEERNALGYRLKFEGVQHHAGGKDHVLIAVNAPEGKFQAAPAMYWSEFNQGYMKKPHIERFLTHDVYISPLEMVGEHGGEDQLLWLSKGETRQVGQVKYTFEDFDREMGDVIKVAARLTVEIGGRTVPARPALEMVGEHGGEDQLLWLSKGETRQVGQVKYTFEDFDREMGDVIKVAARLTVEIGGRTVPARPVLEMNMASSTQTSVPDYLPGGGTVSIGRVDPNTGRVGLKVPGQGDVAQGGILAVEVSTKPFINLVWLGAVLMLCSALLVMVRRAMEVFPKAAPTKA